MGNSLQGATVLVTGGAGLIGSHIVDQLIDEGAGEVRVLDNFVRGRHENLARAMDRAPITLIEGDVRDPETVKRAVRRCDYVFHQAAIRITLCAEKPRECMDVLVMGTFNVFEAAVEAGVKKIVYASSASVYGGADVFPTDERHHPYNNRTLYGAAKIANEHLLRSYNEMYGLPYVALRYFNLYGPRMDTHGVYTEVMIRWMDRIDEGQPPLIFGDGTQSMDFVYIGDVAQANLAALRSDASDMVFNVASGTQTSLNELSAMLCEVMGRPDLQAEYREERKVNPVRRRLGATELAREHLGFTTSTGLREGLESLVAWRRTVVREMAGQMASQMAGVRA